MPAKAGIQVDLPTHRESHLGPSLRWDDGKQVLLREVSVGNRFERMPTGMTSALSLTNVSKAYGRVRALDRLTFDVAEGRFFALFGPSSVGKTTTLRTIAGLVTPDAGSLSIAGRDVTAAPIKGRGVSMVFQSFALYPHLSVFENFAYPLREEGAGADEIKQRVGEVADMLRLTPRLQRKPSTLSGGEQQRVALGRSLVRRPKLLLLDEPLTNLDAKLRHEMRAELKRLHRQFGMTIVYATPDELEALSMGEEIAVMRDGRVVQQGTPDALYEQPNDLYVASKIGSPHMNLVDGKVVSDGQAVETSLGTFGIAAGKRPADGEAIVVGIRPSDIKLGNGQGLPSTLQLIEPLGDITVLSVGAPGQMLRLVVPESQALGFERGRALNVEIDPAKIYLFRRQDGAAIR